MRVYISADMEGIAGAVTREQLRPEGFEYHRAREQMTREVVAAVEVAFEAGADEVVVSDSHGNGQNIIPENLPAGVTLVRSWPRPLGMMDGIETGEFSCAFLLGYHAGASNPGGSLSHTLSSRALLELKLNGQPASEAMLSAAIAGHHGCPVALVSGDDVFVEETGEFLPDVERIVTKWSRGLFSARCLGSEDVLDMIRSGATAALSSYQEKQPFVLETPIRVELALKSRLAVEYACYLPGVNRTGAHSFHFTADDPVKLVKQISFFLNYRSDLG